ncbi:5-oxoprolinase subunit PxpB [Oscillochloris sp. ZM17-4]|uniref:5-oxoprolinase subunit PxpB n=1 Tax=Oscillochloris sp. ZM17-4 TaxID=2866714 RepID=UPI001C72B8DD|nr:5-oxoprolinase subunit PxpB [Oscillochloris sp. ZM17-4]MBX0326984.1 5-oxoprolinase subunit PxpB [Oscillochloris sp. ZM17-4]
MSWIFRPMGDSALLMEAEDDGGAANRAALDLAAALEAGPPIWLRAVVPAIASLLVCFDPLAVSYAGVECHLRALVSAGVSAGDQGAGRVVRVPVRYGGDDGPDLEGAARTLDISPAELVALHCAGPYRVMMIGFAPGYPYIGPLPDSLRIPRRATPRSAVPAGSVAIAAGLSGIYPARLPGGWHLIGRTDVRLFDPQARPPAALAPGDMVQFVSL